MKKAEVLIIGGGPAAITVVKNLAGKKQVTVIRPEDHSMIYCAMPYAIEGLLGVEKTLKEDKLVTESGAVLVRDKVESVDFVNQNVTTQKGDFYGYETLIVATGADPILPPIEGVALDGVMTFKTEDDLQCVLAQVQDTLQEVVVVGAGAIGIELAQALHQQKIKTHLVDMFPHILPNMLDEDMVGEPQKKLAESGILLHLNNRVTALEGLHGVERVILDQEEPIVLPSGSLVVFAIGMRANVDLFQNTDLQVGRTGIVVDGVMQTNLPHVYAIGDCVEYNSGITGQVLPGKLATNAVPMGKLLAKNLLGEQRVYAGFFNGAATKVLDCYVGSTGLSQKEALAQGYECVVGKASMSTMFPIMPGAKAIHLKLIADAKTRRILGGQVISGAPVADKIDQITMAIQFGISVDQLAMFSYSSQPYQSYYPANNLLTHAAEMILKEC